MVAGKHRRSSSSDWQFFYRLARVLVETLIMLHGDDLWPRT